jgi:hypothetical protein
VLPGILLAGALVACGGEAGKTSAGQSANGAASASACPRPDTTAAYVAFKEYIKVTVPTPQRFLSAAGSDSAAPEDGFRAMQDKGPSFFYGSDAKSQKQIREKLARDGPYASLLIVHRGTTRNAAGDTVTVRLGGHYIGGEHEGQQSANRAVTVVCRESTWKLSKVTEEPAK